MGKEASRSSGAILDELDARGLIHDSTDLVRLRARLDEGPVTLYGGFDPTADSLHVGHLVPLLLLRRFQLHGHRPIVLAGGATGMIGDPSGRSAERNLLDEETIDHNVAAIGRQLAALVDLGGDDPSAGLLVDNREWTSPLSAIEFLRDVGKHVTVGVMLGKESVKARISSAEGLSFTEFSYMLLQANDFRWLHEHEGCELQVGGSDQWGNITAGIDLVRRTSGSQVHGLTVPLITRADGAKFGKTAEGTIWLDPERTSPYHLYQYFVQIPDADVHRLLLQLTFLSVEEVDDLVGAHGRAPQSREAQRRLAFEVTSMVHGDQAATEAQAASVGFSDASAGLSRQELESLVDEIPTTRVSEAVLEAGWALVDLLVEVDAASSKSEARRLIAGGGITVNDSREVSERLLTSNDLLHDRFLVIRRGKRARYLVAVEDA